MSNYFQIKYNMTNLDKGSPKDHICQNVFYADQWFFTIFFSSFLFKSTARYWPWFSTIKAKNNLCKWSTNHHLGINATKLVFRVSDKVRFKPVSSATETSYTINCRSSYDTFQ